MRSLSVTITFLVMLMSGTVFAGDSTGIVTRLYADTRHNRVLFTVEGGIVDTPSCNTENMWSFSLNNAGGKALYAMLLSSIKTGTTVRIMGRNTCSESSDKETPAWGSIND
jgi:hypothetical protein